MQSNQSKLLIAGIVAAQVGATQIETNEAAIEAYQQDYKHVLAQTRDREEGQDDIPLPDSNGNTDSEGNAAELAAKHKFFDGVRDAAEIDDKLQLITSSALAGLTAKSDWYEKKLRNFADEKLQLYNQIDETCRIKLDDTKNSVKQELEDAAATAMTTMRECRLTYVNAILTKKEQLKGQLQNMVNETITNIKELKVDQELNDAGLPAN